MNFKERQSALTYLQVSGQIPEISHEILEQEKLVHHVIKLDPNELLDENREYSLYCHIELFQFMCFCKFFRSMD